MKHLFISLLALLSLQTDAQLPLPCLVYDNYGLGEIELINGYYSAGCLIIDPNVTTSQPPWNLTDEGIRDFVVNDGVILPGFSYTAGSGDDSRFSIVAGNREEMEGVWFEPTHYQPQLYEKIEWGFKLPAEVEAAIDNWIYNDQHPLETPLTPALNPFDPEQVNLHAIIDYTTTNGGVYFSQPVNGFFYREYDRITAYNNPDSEDMSDVNDWYWKEYTTEFRFRIRWSSDTEAHHYVRVKLDVPSMGNWEMQAFEFDSFWGDPRNSFISVTNNGHYFKTVDGHVFFPVGLNINGETFGCSCAEGVEDIWVDGDVMDCATCYGAFDPAGDPLLDPCCGIRRNKRQRPHYITPEIGTTTNPIEPVQGYTLDPAAYVKLEKVLETLKDKGANSFRTLFDPAVYDIEFEKMNNYYDRQYQAWEFDRVVEKCKELDLRIEWNMMIHYALGHHPYGADQFDWDNINNEGNYENWSNGTDGFCYWRELNLDTPLDFLTHPLAIVNYKKKLRYMIARWGYTRNIFLMELVSEMNGIGTDGSLPEADQVSLYKSNPINARPAIANWHNEMARYINEDLHHHRHLISADYAGTAPMQDDASSNPCQLADFDYSWQSDYIDVISFSNYNGALNRWQLMAVHEYACCDQSYGLLCGWDDPNTNNDDNFYHSPLEGYESIWKPVIHAEEGYVQCMDRDFTGFVKDLLAGIFNGHATSGMSWDEWSSSEHWNYMGEALEYLELQVLNDVDLGSGEWLPDHVFSNGRSTASNCQFAEAIYLNNQDSNSPKITGVIFNRSWNNHTVCNCDASNNNVFTGPEEPLNTANLIGWSTDELHLRNAGFHHYTIRYLDPYTKSQIDQVNRWSTPGGDLGLENYPLMYEGTNNHQPFYFFEAFREGSEFDESPMHESLIEPIKGKSIVEGNSTSQVSTGKIESENSLIFEVYPNPGNSFPTLKTDVRFINESYAIHAITGELIQSGTIKNSPQLLDFSNLGNGIYIITCKSYGESTYYIKTN